MFRSALLLAAACAALTLAAACGGDSDAPDADDFAGPTRDPVRQTPPELVGNINAVQAGSDFFVGENNFVFGVTNIDDQPQGGAKVIATFYDLRDLANPKPVFTREAQEGAPGVGKQVEHKHSDGEVHIHGGQDDDRVGYWVKVKFDHAGTWGLAVEAELKDGTKGVSNIPFTVYEKPNMVAPGDKAPKSDNLTKADVKDISEIDSGTPPNDMHDVKIKDAIAKGRPLMVVFSTPAFCTSRFCGPVNEEVEALREEYKDKMDFVHVEIWRDFDKEILNPTVGEWITWPDGSIREPTVYLIDKKGTVYDRWEGPVSKSIMQASVKAVADGATR